MNRTYTVYYWATCPVWIPIIPRDNHGIRMRELSAVHSRRPRNHRNLNRRPKMAARNR